tara:strand:- start:383 stop:940 length:558 start_codon:yes stop_codon:yes gene_type:complete
MPLPLAAIGVGIAATSFLTGQSSQKSAKESEKRQAKIESKYLGEQLIALDKSESQLEPVFQSKMNVAQGKFSEDLQNLSSETGQSKEDLTLNFESILQKTGLATSGSANTKRSQTYKRIGNAFNIGKKGLMGRLGENLGGIEEWYEGEKARLNSERERMKFQKSTADLKSGETASKFLKMAKSKF